MNLCFFLVVERWTPIVLNQSDIGPYSPSASYRNITLFEYCLRKTRSANPQEAKTNISLWKSPVYYKANTCLVDKAINNNWTLKSNCQS